MRSRSRGSPAATAARCARVTPRPRSRSARSSSISRWRRRSSLTCRSRSRRREARRQRTTASTPATRRPRQDTRWREGSGAPRRGFRPGQRVMAHLAGGGYAEEAVVHHGSALPVPETMSDEEAGAFPEVFLTAFSNLFMPGLGALAPGETALVHGGGGGVGTAAILLCREAGNPGFVTAGSDAKCGP